MRIGYARVSTDDQTLDLQRDALKKAKCRQIYEEHASGKNTTRPQLEACLKSVREGDTLIVWDRLFGTRYNGTLINKNVGVSDNYFEQEGVIGGVLLCAAFSIRQFFKSVWTNSWRLSTHYQRKTRGDEGESRTVDASNQLSVDVLSLQA